MLQHDMEDEDRLLHAMPARRRSFGMTLADPDSKPTVPSEMHHPRLVVVHHHPNLTTVLASSACLGEAQIEKTPATQTIKSRNTDEEIFLHFHLPPVFNPGNPMCGSIWAVVFFFGASRPLNLRVREGYTKQKIRSILAAIYSCNKPPGLRAPCGCAQTASFVLGKLG